MFLGEMEGKIILMEWKKKKKSYFEILNTVSFKKYGFNYSALFKPLIHRRNENGVRRH